MSCLANSSIESTLLLEFCQIFCQERLYPFWNSADFSASRIYTLSGVLPAGSIPFSEFCQFFCQMFPHFVLAFCQLFCQLFCQHNPYHFGILQTLSAEALYRFQDGREGRHCSPVFSAVCSSKQRSLDVKGNGDNATYSFIHYCVLTH